MLPALALLLAFTLLGGLFFGAVRLGHGEVFRLLLFPDGSVDSRILHEIRLPRVLLGALVGASLAVSGAILQGIMRNALASPGIIGVSAGGGLAGVLLLLALPGLGVYLVPGVFLGALAAALAVYLLAWKQGLDPVRLILSGVAMASMLGALTSMLLLFFPDRVPGVLDFMIGSFSGASWERVRTALCYAPVGLLFAGLLAKSLNVLTLGDETAASLGLCVERTRLLLLATAALLAATAVSVAGLLGFVGLIAPHMVRLMVGADFRFLIPGAALFGAFLAAGCDILGRLTPSELPVGLIMALLGPPFFLYLLRRGER